MNTLIYKRTHRGDPNESGVFGVWNCMGQIRGWEFDAVIGMEAKVHGAVMRGSRTG